MSGRRLTSAVRWDREEERGRSEKEEGRVWCEVGVWVGCGVV